MMTMKVAYWMLFRMMQSPSTDKSLVEESLRAEIGRVLDILEDREKKVIEAYFGINQREMTLEGDWK